MKTVVLLDRDLANEVESHAESISVTPTVLLEIAVRNYIDEFCQLENPKRLQNVVDDASEFSSTGYNGLELRSAIG